MIVAAALLCLIKVAVASFANPRDRESVVCVTLYMFDFNSEVRFYVPNSAFKDTKSVWEKNHIVIKPTSDELGVYLCKSKDECLRRAGGVKGFNQHLASVLHGLAFNFFRSLDGNETYSDQARSDYEKRFDLFLYLIDELNVKMNSTSKYRMFRSIWEIDTPWTVIMRLISFCMESTTDKHEKSVWALFSLRWMFNWLRLPLTVITEKGFLGFGTERVNCSTFGDGGVYDCLYSFFETLERFKNNDLSYPTFCGVREEDPAFEGARAAGTVTFFEQCNKRELDANVVWNKMEELASIGCVGVVAVSCRGFKKYSIFVPKSDKRRTVIYDVDINYLVDAVRVLCSKDLQRIKVFVPETFKDLDSIVKVTQKAGVLADMMIVGDAKFERIIAREAISLFVETEVSELFLGAANVTLSGKITQGCGIILYYKDSSDDCFDKMFPSGGGLGITVNNPRIFKSHKDFILKYHDAGMLRYLFHREPIPLSLSTPVRGVTTENKLKFITNLMKTGELCDSREMGAVYDFFLRTLGKGYLDRLSPRSLIRPNEH